jgi:hypothetical protein
MNVQQISLSTTIFDLNPIKRLKTPFLEILNPSQIKILKMTYLQIQKRGRQRESENGQESGNIINFFILVLNQKNSELKFK